MHVPQVNARFIVYYLNFWLLRTDLILIGLPCLDRFSYPTFVHPVLWGYHPHFEVEIALHCLLSLVWVSEIFPQTELVIYRLSRPKTLNNFISQRALLFRVFFVGWQSTGLETGKSANRLGFRIGALRNWLYGTRYRRGRQILILLISLFHFYFN